HAIRSIESRTVILPGGESYLPAPGIRDLLRDLGGRPLRNQRRDVDDDGCLLRFLLLARCRHRLVVVHRRAGSPVLATLSNPHSLKWGKSPLGDGDDEVRPAGFD